MRLYWVAATAMAGVCCSFAGGEPGGQRGDDAGTDGRSVDGQDASDIDGDGIDDAVDNCPDDPNAGQENEDLDARGNACDVCPHIADDDQSDGDNDGVGDACDPQPGPANTWLFFSGFDSDLLDNDWVGEDDFTVSDGALHSKDNLDVYYLRNDTFSHGANALIGASMRFTNPAQQGNPPDGGIRFGGPIGRGGTNASHNGCWVLQSISEGIEGYTFMESELGILSRNSLVEAPLTADSFAIEMVVAGEEYVCRFRPLAQNEMMLTQSSSANAATSRIGVVSSRTDTDVRYLFAISLQ